MRPKPLWRKRKISALHSLFFIIYYLIISLILRVTDNQHKYVLILRDILFSFKYGLAGQLLYYYYNVFKYIYFFFYAGIYNDNDDDDDNDQCIRPPRKH